MKNLTFGAAMALSVAASTAQSQNAAPTMLMDELVVKNQTIEGSAASLNSLLPILILFILVVVVATAADNGGMYYASSGYSSTNR